MPSLPDPDTFYEVLTAANKPRVFVACDGDQPVIVVTIKRNKRRTKHIYYRDLDHLVWGAWDEPIGQWKGELRRIAGSEFEASLR